MLRLAPDEKLVAIDPGRDKCGLAVVDGAGRLLDRLVAPTPELTVVVAPVLSKHGPSHAIVGGGTGSADVQAALRQAFPELRLDVVPEHRSTERALERWRDMEKPIGWRRLLPRSLRFPRGPIDDYAAWILAEDHLADRDP